MNFLYFIFNSVLTYIIGNFTIQLVGFLIDLLVFKEKKKIEIILIVSRFVIGSNLTNKIREILIGKGSLSQSKNSPQTNRSQQPKTDKDVINQMSKIGETSLLRKKKKFSKDEQAKIDQELDQL